MGGDVGRRLPITLPTMNVRSVRFRATAWGTATVGLLVLLSGLAINWIVSREVRAAADAVLVEQASDRAQLLGAGAAPASLVNVVGDEVVAAVIGPDGRVLALAGTDDPAPLAVLQPGIATLELALVDDDDGDHEEVGHREEVRVATAVAGDGSTIVVGNEGEPVNQTLGAVRAVLGIGGPLIVVVGALTLWFVTGRSLRPAVRLRDDLDGIVRLGPSGTTDDGSPTRVTEPGTADEIDDLAATLNDVLGRLERQSEARRQFVADASHELKSPVANARILIETAPPAPAASADVELRARLLTELDRLQSLVDDLLFLARTDETTPSVPEPFDLDDVAFDEAERAAIRTGLRIDASGIQPARVVADRGEVARAVRNLVENAVRHGRTRVVIAIEGSDAGAFDGGAGRSGWTVVVADDGPGIAPADRDRVFARFARLAPERSRDEGGTGLGLSIVEGVAARNGGSVRLADHDGPGARFELTLPAAP